MLFDFFLNINQTAPSKEIDTRFSSIQIADFSVPKGKREYVEFVAKSFQRHTTTQLLPIWNVVNLLIYWKIDDFCSCPLFTLFVNKQLFVYLCWTVLACYVHCHHPCFTVLVHCTLLHVVTPSGSSTSLTLSNKHHIHHHQY